MERINCEILDLRAFLMVVELGSFHRTAEALNLSQPALSRRIQKLEAAIGSPLLERTTRHVAPTAIGEDLLPLVRRMLEEFDGSLFASRDPKRRGGIVSMACLPTAAFYFLPEVIRAFSVDHPETRFRILDLPATDGLQAVARGEVEFGVNIMGASDPDLVFDRLVEDPFVLAARKGHPLAEREWVTWTDLAPYPLITVHRSSANRVLLNSMLAKVSLSLRGPTRSRTSRRRWGSSRPASASRFCRAWRHRRATTPSSSPARSAIRRSPGPSVWSEGAAGRSRPPPPPS